MAQIKNCRDKIVMDIDKTPSAQINSTMNCSCFWRYLISDSTRGKKKTLSRRNCLKRVDRETSLPVSSCLVSPRAGLKLLLQHQRNQRQILWLTGLGSSPTRASCCSSRACSSLKQSSASEEAQRSPAPGSTCAGRGASEGRELPMAGC